MSATQGLRRSALIAGALCFALLALLAPAAGASTYANGGGITINDMNAATPYPSTIGVSGLPGTVVRARVTLNGVNHPIPQDIDALLVGPGGAKTFLMSDACGAVGSALTGQVFTFDDAAPAALPSGAGAACPSGSFKPTNFDDTEGDDIFPTLNGPPVGPYVATLSVFNGGPPNGTWQLFVRDDKTVGTGSIAGGWSLDLLPSVTCGGKQATIAGTAANDTLVGTAAADVMVGLGGNDTMSGLGGNDTMCGGDGNDKLNGGSGKDKLFGERGKDKLKGGGGSKDKCIGGPKKDKASSCETERSI
jgi:Ca2+-binding RTX toxin-like protein